MDLKFVVTVLAIGQVLVVGAQRRCLGGCECTRDAKTNRAVIDCSNKGLTEIPIIDYPYAVQLARIDFSNNQLTSIDIDRLFTKIRGLRVDVLNFSNNAISEIVGRFDDGRGTEYSTLDLSNNLFTEFPANAVPRSTLRSNVIIDVSYNRITEVPRHMFAGTSDKILYGVEFLARNNQISRVDPEAFVGVDLVDTVIDLRFNQLSTLSSDFKTPRGVRKILLAGNPWQCDCNLGWMIDPSRNLVNYTESDPPACQEPVVHRGVNLFELPRDEFACAPTQDGSLTSYVGNTGSFEPICPVTADPPNPDVTWTVTIPAVTPGGDDVILRDLQGLNSFPTSVGASFSCTASNAAGSVTLDLDIRYE